MQCPHCRLAFHSTPRLYGMNSSDFYPPSTQKKTEWIDDDSDMPDFDRPKYEFQIIVHHCPSCHEYVVEAQTFVPKIELPFVIYPHGPGRPPTPKEIPPDIARDYEEAASTLPFSARASATLSRRCLQQVLRNNGYKASSLAKEVEKIAAEKDPQKAISTTLRQAIDGVRHFGNFSAHPVEDKEAAELIDVEPEEAEWCLKVLEEMFDHFYVKPAHAREMQATLAKKLAKAGKLPNAPEVA